MSLTGAFNAARSGLNATQTMSRISADNVANAMTPGYVRRNAILVSSGAGPGGVVVGEIRREVNESLIRMSRAETAKMTRQQIIHEALTGYTTFLGQPGDGTSPAEKFTEFQSSLTTLGNTPSSQGVQAAAIWAAEDLAASLRGASDVLASTRAEVDMEIRYEVSDLNQALYDVSEMNGKRSDFEPGTFEAIQFADQFDRVLDRVSELVDIRISRTADGSVSIYTTSGAALVEGSKVQDITFNAGDGTLMAGSQDVTPQKQGVRGMEHGSLAGLVEMKRDIIPRFQSQLDEYARSLIETFESADSSLAAGQAGLFTDNGSAFDPAKLTGLAGRIQVNELVTGQSPETWRIRDGLGAVAPGDAASSSQILAFINVLDTPANAAPNSGISPLITLAELGSEIISMQVADKNRAESNFFAASSAAEVIRSARQNGEGVNIDDEMQKLMLIEQSYAANSRIITSVSEMIDTLIAAV